VPTSAFSVQPFALKDTPALIERLLPVQKLSAESYKEQMAVHGKTLTALGSYWKGRKPLILNKACILGCLLPATDHPKRDLEIFEKLMAMDDESFVARWPRRAKPRELLATLTIACTADYFVSDPPLLLPPSAPVDWSKPELEDVKVHWRGEFLEPDEWKKLHPNAEPSEFNFQPSAILARRQLEAQMLPKSPYRERVEKANRPEEVADTVHDHIWGAVNAHLGTTAHSFPELVEQLGIMRFGHRPRFADTFCGSGQIPFEAARLGCEVYASDLNPVACLLTWGAFNIVGCTPQARPKLEQEQRELVERVKAAINTLCIEADGTGWQARAFLYCAEVVCPESGWRVPLLPTRVVSKRRNVVADLVPDQEAKRYDLVIRSGVSNADMEAAEMGTLGREGKYGEAFLLHLVNGVTYKTKITTLRGDHLKADGTTANRLRMWAKTDIVPHPGDIIQERLYCVQWTRPKKKGKRDDYEFRSVSKDDLRRESLVQEYVGQHLAEVYKLASNAANRRLCNI
jgi:putative DNA methylase